MKLFEKMMTLFMTFYRGDEDEVLYISGAETLPPPLEQKDEIECLIALSGEYNEDEKEDARVKLISHNLRLVAYLARKFENTGVCIEDLISIGTIGLIKGINTFNADKNIKLATYASRCIENEILMYIRKRSPAKCEVSIDEPLNIDWDGNELLLSDILGCEEDSVSYELERREECRVIREAIGKLSEREQLIIGMRFGLGENREMTQKEVADMLGISQSYISRIEKKIIARLRREIAGKI